jgi:hypothetical protein
MSNRAAARPPLVRCCAVLLPVRQFPVEHLLGAPINRRESPNPLAGAGDDRLSVRSADQAFHCKDVQQHGDELPGDDRGGGLDLPSSRSGHMLLLRSWHHHLALPVERSLPRLPPGVAMTPHLDDLVGLDGILTPLGLTLMVDHARQRRARAAVAIKSGLAPFLHLPEREPRTLTRARMAETIVRLVAANGCITHEDLTASGFEVEQIDELFTEARRIAQVERMAA